MKKHFITLALLAIFIAGVTGCSNSEKDMQEIVTRHIKANTYPNEQLEIKSISKPDSTFGIMYMSEKEIVHITDDL